MPLSCLNVIAPVVVMWLSRYVLERVNPAVTVVANRTDLAIFGSSPLDKLCTGISISPTI
jgi:hypothetical protein